MSLFFLAPEASWGAPPWRCGAGLNSEFLLRARCDFFPSRQKRAGEPLRGDVNSMLRHMRKAMPLAALFYILPGLCMGAFVELNSKKPPPVNFSGGGGGGGGG